jgi:hypothetical protein
VKDKRDYFLTLFISESGLISIFTRFTRFLFTIAVVYYFKTTLVLVIVGDKSNV